MLDLATVHEAIAAAVPDRAAWCGETGTAPGGRWPSGARPSERWGQEIVAVVELTTEVGDDDLRAACARHLARYKIPKSFVRVERAPRLPNGKADYAAARAATQRPAAT
jgi:acyl-CoA synthetase (AMP-forming)/AMP-acid ligase II